MNIEPPKADPRDFFQSIWYRLGLLVYAIYLIVLWFALTPSSPLFAMSVVAGTFSLGPAVAAPMTRCLPPQWFRVPIGERALHRILGVGIFGWLLEATGWNRLVAKPMRQFSGSRSGLTALEKSLRSNASAHGTCFAIHAILAVFGLFSSKPWNAAFGMLLPGVAVHFYPLLVQRSIMIRLQPLFDRATSTRTDGKNEI